MDYSKAIIELEKQIEKESKIGNNVDVLVNEQIKLFLKARNELLTSIKEKNIQYNLNIAEAEIGQLTAVISLCKKINQPYEKYEQKIKEIQSLFVGDNVTIEQIIDGVLD